MEEKNGMVEIGCKVDKQTYEKLLEIVDGDKDALPTYLNVLIDLAIERRENNMAFYEQDMLKLLDNPNVRKKLRDLAK